MQEETRKGPWTEQEDLRLICFVGLLGERRWDFIAKVSGLRVVRDTTHMITTNRYAYLEGKVGEIAV